jgi:uncharacterized membrane protein
MSNRWFMGLILLAALGCGLVACVAVGITALATWSHPRTAYLLAGALLYLVGTVLVTLACNVPRNEALAALDPYGAEAATQLGPLRG